MPTDPTSATESGAAVPVLTGQADLLARVAADRLALAVLDALARRSACVLALTGGSTPRQAYGLLARAPLPWHRVHVVQTDEHLGPGGGPGPSWRTVCEALLDPAGVPPECRHPMPVGPDVAGPAADYARQLAALLPDGRPDAVLLGLGDDGHTASLFHGDPATAASGPVAATEPYRGVRRLTLTLPVLAAAPVRLVLAAGAAKRAAVARVTSGDVTTAAAVRVLRGDGLLLADPEAAGGPAIPH